MSASSGPQLRPITAKSTTQPPITPDCEARELQVIIRPYDLEISEYEGTRAQLDAEGVIPKGFEWPDGDDYVHWTSGACSYWVRRIRPAGMKGPRAIWLTGDWWRVRWELLNKTDRGAREIKRKSHALAAAIHDQSAAGRREWDAYCNAKEDTKFWAFKALIPGLVRNKRGRKPAATTVTRGAQQ